MSVKTIVRLGAPILIQKAQLVTEFNSVWLKELIKDLFDTMYSISAIGLAAPQINVNARVMVMGPNSKRPNIPELAIVNPVYKVTDDSQIGNWESCFSIPGMKAFINRYSAIEFSGLTIDNKPIQGIAKDWQSIIFQHETDHLDGITLLHRLDNYSMFGFKEEIDNSLVKL